MKQSFRCILTRILEFLILCPALRRQRRNAWRAALLIRQTPKPRECCQC